jgi:two-component system chemotaxis response regulator CheB
LPTPSHNRDIVVIGASAGGVEAMRQLVTSLPRTFPAALFVVIHLDPLFESRLAQLLSRPGGLLATSARDGEAIRPGRIWIAPPDHHLLVRSGRIEVMRGPRENGHRPAVDALFRTAAGAYGPRVIGVVMTGYLNCGTAGLLSIKARGGLAVVQDPRDAAAPAMPTSAIKHVAVDHVVPLRDLADLLQRLVETPAQPQRELSEEGMKPTEGRGLGHDVELVCPSCQGKLTASEVGGYSTFRCHVGHTFSLQSLSAGQAEEVERALWASVRALEEAAALSRRLGDIMTGTMRERFVDKEKAQRRHAKVVRDIVLSGKLLSVEDSPIIEAAAAPTIPEPMPDITPGRSKGPGRMRARTVAKAAGRRKSSGKRAGVKGVGGE